MTWDDSAGASMLRKVLVSSSVQVAQLISLVMHGVGHRGDPQWTCGRACPGIRFFGSQPWGQQMIPTNSTRCDILPGTSPDACYP